MTEQNVKYKVLIALLYHHMEKGLEQYREARERELCLLASSLYLVILGLPGSGAFKIFHPVLFSKALDVFGFVSKLKLTAGQEISKRGGGNKSKSQSQSQSQRRRNASGDDDQEEETVLTQREVAGIVDSLAEVLSCLHLMLDHCSLKRSLESLETLVSHLVSLSRLETQFTNLDLNNSQGGRQGDISSLAVNAYLGLMKLCSPLHGEGAGAIRLVLKSLLPGILMVGEGSGRALSVVRANTLRWVHT